MNKKTWAEVYHFSTILEEIIDMLESDRELTGRYAISEATKEYSANVQLELEDLLVKINSFLDELEEELG